MRLLLKEIRLSKQLSQQKLADLSGVTQDKISDYECGKHWPTIPTLARLAMALDINVLDLLSDSQEPEHV